MINQLFRELPDKELLDKILSCYNLKSLDDPIEFTKHTLKLHKTTEKLEELLPELSIIYLPSKYNVYLTNITIKRSVTILRQVLNLFNYKLNKRELVANKQKMIYYYIKNNNKSNIKINKQINIYF